MLSVDGNVGFRAWPTMATAIAIAIVDYDGRLHPASSPRSHLPRKVRKRRSGFGRWQDTATEPPRHGRGRKVTPSRPGAPRNSGKVRTGIFHRFKFRSQGRDVRRWQVAAGGRGDERRQATSIRTRLPKRESCETARIPFRSYGHSRSRPGGESNILQG